MPRNFAVSFLYWVFICKVNLYLCSIQLKKIFLKYGYLACLCVHVPCLCLIPLGGQKGVLGPLELESQMLWVQGIEPRSPGRSTGAFNCHLSRSSLFSQHAFELSLLCLHGPVPSPGKWLWPAWDKYADNNWHSAVGIRTWALPGSVVQALCTWPCHSCFLIYFPPAPSPAILTLFFFFQPRVLSLGPCRC